MRPLARRFAPTGAVRICQINSQKAFQNSEELYFPFDAYQSIGLLRDFLQDVLNGQWAFCCRDVYLLIMTIATLLCEECNES